MALDDDIKDIKGNLETVKNNQSQIYNDMPGCLLYILLGIGIMIGLQTCSDTQEIRKRMNEEPIVRDVIKGPEPEKFYMINGKRAYLEIDGEPVEHE